ncbi:flagellar basal body-associated FliL family protein [Undibacterium griseum]|uniref:Flagellar protein FliL n=1 Tax=Undibacterium griseum TaxID=2762295 RepID=A0ABR6YIL5_9BURK|nr:flagellar basal body-associated FliL family protein [Undibacterium griseum]MBC3883755.1 flagellar basal body-associated FliL family protein [Undibacterium griseum]
MLNITSLKTLLTAILLLSALQSGSALANSGGKEASANAGAPTAVLEPFTVNLSSFDRYLQINITLQVASAEAADKIKLYMPVVRHSMIMLLSGKESSQIQNSEGKHALIDEIKERLNGVLGLKEHDGVTDVFFVNFVIQ